MQLSRTKKETQKGGLGIAGQRGWEPCRLASISAVVGLFLLWYGIGASSIFPRIYLPTPGAVLHLAYTMLLDGELQQHLWISLRRVAIGYALGVGMAIVVGILMGWYRMVDAVINPLYQLWRPIPPIAIIPLIIVWFGIGEPSKIVVIFGGAFATSLITVVTGVRTVPRIYIDAARTFGASNSQIFLRITIPWAIPYILSGARVALAVSFGVMVAAELMASFSGLGFMLTMGKNLLRTDLIFVGIIAIGVLSYATDMLIGRLQAHFTRWMERASS